ncbi:hypothetical protein Gpo141_00011547 [Globisporangium polare]
MLAPSSKTVFTLAAVAIATTPASVDAHGYMSIPKATFTISGDTTQFSGTIDGPSTLTAPSGMSFTTDPASNTKAFTAALKNSSYTSVYDLVEAKGVFISGATKECGITSATGAKQPLPAKYVEWSHSSTEGFTPSHQGPCEVWCDDNLAFSDENCAADYTSAPAELPIDHAKCVGTSLLKIVWLALHSSTWQIYINCAPLESSSSSSAVVSTAASDSGSDETATTATTEAPTVTPTPASASSTGADYEYASDSGSTASSSSTTTTPTPTTTEASTPAPTPSTTKKCSAKTSRTRRN